MLIFYEKENEDVISVFFFVDKHHVSAIYNSYKLQLLYKLGMGPQVLSLTLWEQLEDKIVALASTPWP